MAECDVWVTPKIVVEIKADEITKLRDWAKDTLRIANTPEIKKAQSERKVSVM